jgi:predicted Zn-dependent protease
MEKHKVRLRIFFQGLCVLLAVSLGLADRASAQQTMSYIRDAEIESIIRTYATPIFAAAGLDPAAVHIYIVNDPRLNAFVAGGQNLFINTGTLLRSERPNQLIGVIAHETGHIAGGHLARSQEALHNATIESIIALVVGAAAAVASRNGGAGTAAILGGTGIAERSFLQYSVAQEGSADHAGMTFLDRTQQSARGLLEFFQILQEQEVLSEVRQSPYLRSHPLTGQRIDTVREHVAHSRFSDAKDPPDWIEMHNRMKAKLGAFLGAPAQVLAQYKPEDKSVPARYARAVAYYRVPDLKKAVPEIDGLIHDYPDDPYFQELKGQMLFENGRIREAVAPYERAVKLKPEVALLRIELSQVQLETNDQALVPKALAHLNEAVRFEDRNPDAWRQLAIAQGRSGNMGMMALALAEEAISEGDNNTARQQAARAIKLLPPGPARIRAQDLADEAKRNKDRE